LIEAQSRSKVDIIILLFMRMVRTVFTVVLALILVAAPASAAELNALDCAAAAELAAGTPFPLPSPAFADILEPRKGQGPVVITVAGLSFGELGIGPLEVKHFIRLFELFFPKKTINEEELASRFMAFNRDYFFLEDRDGLLTASGAQSQRKLPDNYLEMKLKEIPGYAAHGVVVKPFPWSRDPGDSATTIPELTKKIIEVYDAYKATGRPVYILAHSWGSVLTHTALHRVARVRPDVRIDKLITAGSPLMPANIVVKLFLGLEVTKEHLEKAVSKPAILKTWRNIWSMRDAYSNAIAAADSNYQADSGVENVEPLLIDLILHNKLLKKEARRDLFKIRSIKDWHSAYFFDYQATLNSIQKEISVAIFKPHLAPEVVN